MIKYLLIFFGIVISAGLGYLFYVTILQQDKPQYTGPVEKIRVGNIGEYSLFNLIAQEKGYFKAHGLDTEITEYASGPPAVAALLAGDVDITVAADFVGVSNSFTHPEIRILSQASRQKVFHMIARRDKGIMTPSDLKGKKIGVTKKGAGEFYLGNFLSFNNIQSTDVTIVDMTPVQMTEQIKSGKIDAIVIFDPHAYTLTKQLGQNSINWSVQGDQDTFALIYTTQDFIDKHPAMITRYMESLEEAEQYIATYPQQAKDFMVEKLHYDKSYVDYMFPNFIFAISLDQELLLMMEDQSRFIIDNNPSIQSPAPNYLNLMYLDALEKTKPEAITIIR